MAEAEERLLGVLWVPERTGIPLKRVCGSQARADLIRALQSFACDVLARYEHHDIGLCNSRIEIPGTQHPTPSCGA